MSGSRSAEAEAAVADAVAVAVAVGPARTPLATLDPDARPTVIPFLPFMPFVADRRETGTDGLMGRLPFDLPADPVAPRVNRFTIDDVVATGLPGTPRRPGSDALGALSGFRAEPVQR